MPKVGEGLFSPVYSWKLSDMFKVPVYTLSDMSKNRVFCGLCLSNGDEHVFMKISYILCIVETTTITIFAYNFENNNVGRITYVFFRHPSLLCNVIYKNCYSTKKREYKVACYVVHQLCVFYKILYMKIHHSCFSKSARNLAGYVN